MVMVVLSAEDLCMFVLKVARLLGLSESSTLPKRAIQVCDLSNYF